jgi:hypothetical protein
VKNLKHPATVIAAVALFVALGGGAAAYASGLISGSRIKNHSIAAKKLTKSAVKSLRGRRGPAGPQGVPGSQGPAGPAGPQGPGGSILTFDANATASPSPTTLGSALGDTWSAECKLTSGSADLFIFLQTTDGSWKYDVGQVFSSTSSSADAFQENFPAGTFSTPQPLGDDQGGTAPSEIEVETDGTQLKPTPGYLSLHVSVFDTTAPAHTCHFEVNTIPETVNAVTAFGKAAEPSSHRNLPLFGRSVGR